MSAPLVLCGSDRRAQAGAQRASAGYALTPDAALVVMEDGNGCVLDMNGKFYAISPIGAAMVRTTLERGAEAAATQVSERYRADQARVRADLDRLLADLERRGILRVSGAEQTDGRGSVGAGIFAALLGALFRLFHGQQTRALIALALARLSFSLFGWRRTVASWRKHLRGQPASAPCERAEALARSIDQDVRNTAARMWLDVDCKERALVCRALAALAGLPATLVIGVAFYPLRGHCWCEIGASIVSDDPANCRRYLPVLRYA